MVFTCGTALALAGCGGGGDDGKGDNAANLTGVQAEVASVVDELQAASRDRDGEKMCGELFTKEYAAEIGRQTDASCADRASEDLSNAEAKLKVQELRVKETSAVATVLEQTGDRTLIGFVKQGGEWRVNAIGRAAGSER